MKTLNLPVWAPETGMPGGTLRLGFRSLGGMLLLLSLSLFALFILSGPLLRLIDPFAASPDLGVLGLVLLGLLSGLAIIAVSRWLLGLLWPVFRDFRNYHFEPIFKSLLPWQKIIIYLTCYFLLLYAFVLCLVVVF